MLRTKAVSIDGVHLGLHIFDECRLPRRIDGLAPLLAD